MEALHEKMEWTGSIPLFFQVEPTRESPSGNVDTSDGNLLGRYPSDFKEDWCVLIRMCVLIRIGVIGAYSYACAYSYALVSVGISNWRGSYHECTAILPLERAIMELPTHEHLSQSLKCNSV